MPRRIAVALRRAPAVVVAVAAVATCAANAQGDRPRESSGLRSEPRVFAFVSNHGGAELERLARVGARIDVVAPNWYGLDAATGELREPWDRQPLLDVAAGHGIEVWPTVNSLTGGSDLARRRIVRALVRVARQHDGVTLDMEELRPDQRDEFTALVRAAGRRVRRLAVYVPRTGAAYDWRALARHADLLLVSGYNEHWSGSRPGPITTRRGFARVLDRALAAAGARAVPLAGAFGYRWPAGELISTVDAARLRREVGATGRRFRVGGDTVVFETAADLRRRWAAARAAGARWVGLFSLGREPASFWRR